MIHTIIEPRPGERSPSGGKGPVNNRSAFLFLHLLRGFDIRHWRRLVAFFPSAEAAVTASPTDWRAAGLPDKLVGEFSRSRTTIDLPEIERQCTKHGLELLTWADADYPGQLKQIHRPPLCLFLKGNRQALSGLPLAIIGSRKLSSYGRTAFTAVCQELPFSQLTIVSGFALGVDGLAHEAALNHDGRTVGVLGSGLDEASWYPPAHKRLGHQLLEKGGLLLSEYPPGSEPRREHFPARNRIIAGLSTAVLVVSARRESGALITARLAIEENRDVLAVPGPITDPTYAGANWLIQQGAAVITTADDVCRYLGVEPVNPDELPLPIKFTEAEQAVVDAVASNPLTIDELVDQLGQSSPEIMTLVTKLELNGVMKDTGGRRYISIGKSKETRDKQDSITKGKKS